MYGKIIDGKLVLAPNPMTVGEYKIYNPHPEYYETEEYLEIIETEHPTDTDKYCEKKYVERDGKIYGEWAEAGTPEYLPPLEDRVSAVEAQITDTQLALCELYESLCAADGEEV